jgi:protein-disulfide isomerase
VEFSDFQCPFCAKVAPILRQIETRYPNQVRLVYMQLPLMNIHPDSLRAAEASLCALSAGKFWEMHDAMFADQDRLDAPSLVETAGRIGLDAAAFKNCLESGKQRAAIQRNLSEAERLALDGTPGILVNGRLVGGTVTIEQLSRVIDEELRNKPGHGSQSPAESKTAATP